MQRLVTRVEIRKLPKVRNSLPKSNRVKKCVSVTESTLVEVETAVECLTNVSTASAAGEGLINRVDLCVGLSVQHPRPRTVKVTRYGYRTGSNASTVSDFSLNIFVFYSGLVVRILGYRSGGPGSIPGTTKEKKVVGLERGPLSLVSTIEELLDRKVAAPV
jgi:hypothetical protein